MVAEAIDSFNILESEIKNGPTPTQDNPIYLRSGNVIFFLDIASEPWPNINNDITHLVEFLSLFTIRYRTVTGIQYAEIRQGPYRPSQPQQSAVAVFILGLDL